MEIAIIMASLLLILFAVLALYDGFYLHIFKYRLHNRAESKTEHSMHTLRAIFFPAILYFLFLKQDSNTAFLIGIAIVIADILVLVVDAFLEKDSRQFMGGLPRWEYIIHLLVNGFHLASIAVFLTIKLSWQKHRIIMVPNLSHVQNHELFHTLIINLLPGAMLMALLHILLCIPKTAKTWDNWRNRVLCC